MDARTALFRGVCFMVAGLLSSCGAVPGEQPPEPESSSSDETSDSGSFGETSSVETETEPETQTQSASSSWSSSIDGTGDESDTGQSTDMETGSETTTELGSDSDSVTLCENGEAPLLWTKADVVSPMVLSNDALVGDYVYTTQNMRGTATTTVSIPCDGEYTIVAWGRTPKITSPVGVPSTFNLKVGLHDETVFELGSTEGVWRRVSFSSALGSTALWLKAGEHTVVVRGGQSNGSGEDDYPSLGALDFSMVKP